MPWLQLRLATTVRLLIKDHFYSRAMQYII